ncbi:MAG: hypothetical protein ACLVFA_09250, partial [Butyricicoccus sp.]
MICYRADSLWNGGMRHPAAALRIAQKNPFLSRERDFSLSKKQYLIFMLRAAARIQSNLLCKF